MKHLVEEGFTVKEMSEVLAVRTLYRRLEEFDLKLRDFTQTRLAKQLKLSCLLYTSPSPRDS